MKKIKNIIAYKGFKAMADLCGGITIGAEYDCETPIVAGVNQRLILLNKADYDEATVTESSTTPGLITNIVLKAGGVKGYAFEGIRKSLNPQTAFVPAAVSVGYDHQVEFLIFDISQAQKNNIEKLATGQGVVAIIQNTNSEGNKDSVFEVFGRETGLILQAGPMRINGDLETNGAYTINLKTSDDFGKEPHLPASYWDTDYATTKAKVDTLLVATT